MGSLIPAIVAALLPLSAVHATGQQADQIVLETRWLPLLSNPLEHYTWPDRDRPSFHVAPGVISTGNWRGYVALWEISGDRLYLVAIDSYLERVDGDRRSWAAVHLDELFSDRLVRGRVFASWFSGELRVPLGSLVEYVHSGYESKYSEELYLVIESGHVKDVFTRRHESPRRLVEPDEPTAWEIYLSEPSAANAANVEHLRYSDADAAHLLSWHLGVLMDQVAAADRQAIRLAFRLLPQLDTHDGDDVLDGLGRLVRTEPGLFLDSLEEYRENVALLEDLLLDHASSEAELPGAFVYEGRQRLEVLETYYHPGASQVRQECVETLRRALSAIETALERRAAG